MDKVFHLAYETALTIKGGMEETGAGRESYGEVISAVAAEDSLPKHLPPDFYSIVMGCMGCILQAEGKKLSDVPKFNLKAYHRQRMEILAWEARFPNTKVERFK